MVLHIVSDSYIVCAILHERIKLSFKTAAICKIQGNVYNYDNAILYAKSIVSNINLRNFVPKMIHGQVSHERITHFMLNWTESQKYSTQNWTVWGLMSTLHQILSWLILCSHIRTSPWHNIFSCWHQSSTQPYTFHVMTDREWVFWVSV